MIVFIHLDMIGAAGNVLPFAEEDDSAILQDPSATEGAGGSAGAGGDGASAGSSDTSGGAAAGSDAGAGSAAGSASGASNVANHPALKPTGNVLIKQIDFTIIQYALYCICDRTTWHC